MSNKQNLKINKGFSLIELLATIFIISLVLGISTHYVLKTINNSNDTSNKITMNNILKTASLYAEESPDDILWTASTDPKESFGCVSIQTLVNKGYLQEKDLTILKDYTYVILTKNENDTILKEEFAEKEVCESVSDETKSPIPTSNEYCKNITYNPSFISNPAILTKDLDENTKFEFSNNTGINAGTYQVTAKLKEGYSWTDNTTEDKFLSCSIKKNIPTLQLDSYGSDGKPTEKIHIMLSSDTSGIISLKTSNKDYAIASVSNRVISKNENKDISIEVIATRNSPTYITITLTPDDTINYYSTSVVYTIGKVTQQNAEIPTTDYCSNPVFNNSEQILTKNPGTGYLFSNNTGIEIRNDYEITANLKYGYVWTDGSTTPKSITCPMLMRITYDNNGGSGCTNKTVKYGDSYGELCTPTKTGYQFQGWYTSSSGGTQITSSIKITEKKNITIYAHWTPTYYLLDINPDNNSYGTNYANGSRIASFDVRVVAEDGVTVLDEQRGISDYYASKGTYNSTYYITNVKYKDGYHYNNYGFSVNGVNISTATGTSFTFKHNIASNLSFSINTAINVCTITYNPNYGTFNSNATDTIQTMNYGTSTSNMKNASGGTYQATRTGYHINAGSAWISSLGGTFDQTKGYSATDFCPSLASGNQSVTLYANWQINVCTIQYKPNGGTFGDNANNTIQTMNYGTSTSNMRNASGGTYKAKRSGYKIKASEAWIKQDGTTYDQTAGYNATDFCPNLKNGNQTVSLYVYWYRIQKRTYSCGTQCVAGTVTNCFSGWNISTCNRVEGGYWKNGKCCQDSYSSCASTKTSCAWSSWSTVNSCSSSSTVKCRTQHPTLQD